MTRRALLVGINRYDSIVPELNWCTDDALAMREMLEFHANHDPNFACRVMLGSQSLADVSGISSERVGFIQLRAALEELLAFDDMVVFYYSGHGVRTERGWYLATTDGTTARPGLLMNDLLDMANASSAREVVLLIDCCSSGSIGEPFSSTASDGSESMDLSNLYLRPGITVLAAAQSDQRATEIDGQGVFTRLMLGALKGGAADVRGVVSAAAVYAYVEQALGPWDQRPMYKSNASRLSPLRYCAPDISDEELRRLPQFFPTAEYQYFLNSSYEVTHQDGLPEHIAIFKIFKHYQVARLLRPSIDEDLYFAAIRAHPVELTPLGQFYWHLAKRNLLGGIPSFTSVQEKSYESHARRRICRQTLP